MKAIYNVVTFFAAVVILSWAGFQIYTNWDVITGKQKKLPHWLQELKKSQIFDADKIKKQIDEAFEKDEKEKTERPNPYWFSYDNLPGSPLPILPIVEVPLINPRIVQADELLPKPMQVVKIKQAIIEALLNAGFKEANYLDIEVEIGETFEIQLPRYQGTKYVWEAILPQNSPLELVDTPHSAADDWKPGGVEYQRIQLKMNSAGTAELTLKFGDGKKIALTLKIPIKAQ